MPDARNALDAAIGATAALLAVPLVALLPWLPATPVVSAGAAVGVGAVFHAGARASERLPHRFTVGAALLTGLLPVASGGWFVFLLAGRSAFRPAFAVGTAAVVPVFAALVAAHEVRLAAWTGSATVVERFEARAPPRVRRLGLYGAVSLFAGGIVVGGVAYALDGDLGVFTALPLAVSGFTWLPALHNERDVRIAEEGVRIARTYYDWDAFSAYEVTDDAVVLHRSGLRPSRRFDRSDVDDLDAVEAALGRFLPAAS